MSHYFQFRIDQRDAGRRVDDFFASRFGSLSRMRVASLIDAGACLVNGAAARPGSRLVFGDSVEISFDDGAPTSMFPEAIPLDVIYEDEYLIVVVKPAGMLVHPTMSVRTGTLANALAHHLNREFYTRSAFSVPGSGSENPQHETRNSELGMPAHGHEHSLTRPGIVHRLDRATSGLIVVAKTPRSLAVLSRHFRKRLVEKRYLALVHGDLKEDAGSISAPIGRDPDQRPRWRVMSTGKPAETRFKLLERLGPATLLELEPVTGRTNQLRIHCAHVGHPIVGDEMHGTVVSSQWSVVSSTPPSRACVPDISSHAPDHWPLTTGHCPPRLCLHAWKLAFHHPANGEWMKFTTPVPDDFAAIVDLLRRQATHSPATFLSPSPPM